MTRTTPGTRPLVCGLLAALVLASCTSSSSTSTPSGSPGGGIAKGGVYRVGVTTFGNTDGLDPTGRIRHPRLGAPGRPPANPGDVQVHAG